MKIINRKASFNAQLLETMEAGIALTGAEVKAVRAGHADLSSSYVRIMNGEAYLVNAQILPYQYARPDNYEPSRTRKLLLHKKELISIRSKMDGANLTLVPVSLYTTRQRIKLEIALGKPKKKFDKKESLKKRTIERDIQEALKNRR
jgi:SsrA-binding protein